MVVDSSNYEEYFGHVLQRQGYITERNLYSKDKTTMRLLYQMACIVGIISPSFLAAGAFEASQPLSEERMEQLYGGAVLPAGTCYVDGTNTCQNTAPAADCTTTKCVNAVCPANTKTVVLTTQPNYPDVSGTSDTTKSGGSTPKADIYCTTTTTCNGCLRPLGSFITSCATGTGVGKGTDPRTPTVADGTKCATGPM